MSLSPLLHLHHSKNQVISFEKEAELLATWHRFLIECDADIVTGYNIVGFDLPYLITRADTLKASSTH